MKQTHRRAQLPADDTRLPVAVVGDSVVGVTVWRLRRPTAADSGERILVQEGTDYEAWIPERISANTKLTPGERLRVSVEAARSGYLYVIDREQYADGSFSEPYLIFPTTRTLNGDNKVDIGKLIEIPAQDDGPPFFTLKKSRPDQVAEVLSMLITPQPLDNIEINDKAQKLSAEQVAAWEKHWSTQVGSVELESGAGQTWTKDEKEAGANRDLVLNAHAPAPQVFYYRAASGRLSPCSSRCSCVTGRPPGSPSVRVIANSRLQVAIRECQCSGSGVRKSPHVEISNSVLRTSELRTSLQICRSRARFLPDRIFCTQVSPNRFVHLMPA